MSSVIETKRLAAGLAETAKLVGVSVPFLRLEISRKRLRTSKVGRRVLIPIKAIEQWLQAGER